MPSVTVWSEQQGIGLRQKVLQNLPAVLDFSFSGFRFKAMPAYPAAHDAGIADNFRLIFDLIQYGFIFCTEIQKLRKFHS